MLPLLPPPDSCLLSPGSPPNCIQNCQSAGASVGGIFMRRSIRLLWIALTSSVSSSGTLRPVAGTSPVRRPCSTTDASPKESLLMLMAALRCDSGSCIAYGAPCSAGGGKSRVGGTAPGYRIPYNTCHGALESARACQYSPAVCKASICLKCGGCTSLAARF